MPNSATRKVPVGGARGGGGGQGGRGDRLADDSDMATTSMLAEMIVDQIAQLSSMLANMQADSSHAMSIYARGAYLKLHTLILVSGCSKHMSPNWAIFVEYRELPIPSTVWFGGGALAQSVGIGKLLIMQRANNAA